MIIFGYGSLINEESVKRSASSAKNFRVGRVYGFRRVFNLKALRRVGKYGPIAVLNIENSKKDHINGLFFDINEKDFSALKDREILYDFIPVSIESELGKIEGLTVQATGRETTDYRFGCEVQEEYLNICIEGCAQKGEKCLKEFLETTFIKEKNLLEVFPGVIKKYRSS